MSLFSTIMHKQTVLNEVVEESSFILSISVITGIQDILIKPVGMSSSLSVFFILHLSF